MRAGHFNHLCQSSDDLRVVRVQNCPQDCFWLLRTVQQIYKHVQCVQPVLMVRGGKQILDLIQSKELGIKLFEVICL